jgi:hypothetical protein
MEPITKRAGHESGLENQLQNPERDPCLAALMLGWSPAGGKIAQKINA